MQLNKKIKVFMSYDKPVPLHLDRCIASVEAYAKRIKAEFIYVPPAPWWDHYYRRASGADYQRFLLLAQNPYSFWFDWDVLVHKNFPEPGDDPMMANVFLMYSGKNGNEFFKKALAKYEQYRARYHEYYRRERGRLEKIASELKYKTVFEKIPDNVYSHLNNFKRRKHNGTEKNY